MFAGHETVPAGQSGEANTKISGVFLPSPDSDDGLLPDCVPLVRLCLVRQWQGTFKMFGRHFSMEIESRFVIGKIDLESGRTYGWLSILANKTGKDFTIYINENGTRQVSVGLQPCLHAHCYPRSRTGQSWGRCT